MLTVAEYSFLSDRGAVRESNQDYAFFYEPRNKALHKTRGGLFALADGTGGYRYGEEASRLAVEALIDHYYSGIQLTAPDQLREAFAGANKALRSKVDALGGVKMGTTLTSVALVNDSAFIAHVGDTRAYLLRAGAMEQLTEDHNKASDLVRSGEMSAEEAAQSALRSRLTRSLGNKDDVTADVVERPLQEGDIVLLCSDGVHTLLSDEEMRDAVRNTGTLKESCRAIIDLALSRGAPDNATVVVFRVGSHTASRFSVHPPGKGERLAKSLSAAGLLAILAIGLIILVHGSRVYSEFRQARAKSTLPYPAATATPTYAPLVVYTERPLKAILMKTDRGLKAVQFKAWREDRLFVQAANRVPAGEWEIIFAFEKDRIYRRLIHGYPESVVSLGDGVPTAPTASARASAAPGSSASPAPAASSAPGPSTSPALPPAASDTPAGGNP